MIGLVIVSHSRALAKALVDLVGQVAGQEVTMAIAAGVGTDRAEFGTDAVEIMEAIQTVFNPDGVLVLMDLGSAVLSAQMALELLPPEMQSKVRFCAAPIVEGAIAAGVQASLDSDLVTACKEASRALVPKAEQLGELLEEAPEAELPESAPGSEEAEEEIVLTLKNAHGLHARPAARFVKLAASFNARVQVRNVTKHKGPVSANSLNALATLGAVHGDEISIQASGAQAEQAIQALSQLVKNNFGETGQVEPIHPLPTHLEKTAVAEGATQAVPVSEGVAIGPLYTYRPPVPSIPKYQVEDAQAAWEHLNEAIETTRQSIVARRRQVAASLGEEQADIFDAHLLILSDPELMQRTRDLIFEERKNEAAALHQAISELADAYRALEDEYQQQRAADVIDVGEQVLHVLSGNKVDKKIEFPEPVILFASELTPTQTAQLDIDHILGIITMTGGPTSHSAILARSMGIPAVAGADPSLQKHPEGVQIGLDGFEGQIWIDPPHAMVRTLEERRAAWLERRKRLLKLSHQPAVTTDHHRVEVAANVGKLLDAEMAAKNGAEAVGLLRTEFLFLTRETPPDEDEQAEALRQIGEKMQGRPIIVRTLDVGGDKPLPYLDLPVEANPFLGVRAIRMSLQRPDLFQTQLRAILRAGAEHHLRIMFPMIASLDEVVQARRTLAEMHAALQDEGIAHRWPVETGIMIEVPSAALLAPVLAKHVDFFSVGTNDLTQYTLAAERGNPELSYLADALHPAVLRLISQVVEAAHQEGKWVGVCGELAGDLQAVPVLVGLGVDELSLNPGGVPQVKAALRAIEFSKARELAAQVLNAEDASAARKLAKTFISKYLQALT